MMKSEFIERTGFEPTGEEYEAIEQEYMGCDIDKDQFCKEWKKNGGAARLMRLRASKIEELKSEVAKLDKLLDETTTNMTNRYREKERRYLSQIEQLKAENESLKEKADSTRATLEGKFKEAHARAIDAELKLETIKSAFEIISGREK